MFLSPVLSQPIPGGSFLPNSVMFVSSVVVSTRTERVEAHVADCRLQSVVVL